MEDKMFELMTKMYAEMQAMNEKMDTKFAEVDKRFESIDKRFDDVTSEIRGVKQDIVRLENKMDEKFRALFDGHTQHEDRLERLEAKVDKVIDNYDRQDVKIEVIHTRAK